MNKPRNPNDLIKIEDAIKILCKKTCHPGVFCPDIYCTEMWDEFENIEKVNAVLMQHGQWIHHDSNDNHVPPYDECSQCGWKVRIGLNYCPKCGARMDGEENGNEID